MSRTRFNRMNCAVAQALDQIGDWWTLLIVREAIYRKSSFSEFQESLGIARNILAERLKRLVDAGIFVRTQRRPEVDRHSYHLTPKGRALLPVVIALMQWGDRWVVGRGAEPVRILDTKTRKPIEAISVRSSAGDPLSIEDLLFTPGRGAEPKLRRLLELRNKPNRARRSG